MRMIETLKARGVEVIVTDNAEKEAKKFRDAHISRALSADGRTGVIFFGGFQEKRSAGLAFHHVAIIREEDIKEGIISAYTHATLKSDSVFASSSPSKTADIEGKLIFGMHGPKKFTVIVEVKE